MATIGADHMLAKLVLLGDMGVGKSSLALRFAKGQFSDYQDSTVGAAFLTHTSAVNETTVEFEIWDSAGQEICHSLALGDAAAVIIVYDITNTVSFWRAKKWVHELQLQGNPNLVIALVGNKADLASKKKIETEEGRAYAEENGLFFMETSAKAAQNVNELFYEMVMKLSGAQPTQAAGMAITDGSGLCLSSFLSARLIPSMGNGPILTVFEKIYIFREVENELRLSFQNEVL